VRAYYAQIGGVASGRSGMALIPFESRVPVLWRLLERTTVVYPLRSLQPLAIFVLHGRAYNTRIYRKRTVGNGCVVKRRERR
jgi:hypothetical protein